MNVGQAKGVGPASGLLEAPAAGWRASLHGLDRWLGIVTEIPAAALVLADIVVLFTGVGLKVEQLHCARSVARP